jgi:hypothetical protein
MLRDGRLGKIWGASLRALSLFLNRNFITSLAAPLPCLRVEAVSFLSFKRLLRAKNKNKTQLCYMHEICPPVASVCWNNKNNKTSVDLLPVIQLIPGRV